MVYLLYITGSCSGSCDGSMLGFYHRLWLSKRHVAPFHGDQLLVALDGKLTSYFCTDGRSWSYCSSMFFRMRRLIHLGRFSWGAAWSSPIANVVLQRLSLGLASCGFSSPQKSPVFNSRHPNDSQNSSVLIIDIPFFGNIEIHFSLVLHGFPCQFLQNMNWAILALPPWTSPPTGLKWSDGCRTNGKMDTRHDNWLAQPIWSRVQNLTM